MKLVNLRDKPTCPYIYVGRAMAGRNQREGSPLGNPFKVGRHKDPIALYRQWLWDKIKAQDRSVMALLEHITERSFTPGERYSERVVDDALRRWCEGGEADHVTLRRYLIDDRLLARDHGVYWRP